MPRPTNHLTCPFGLLALVILGGPGGCGEDTAGSAGVTSDASSTGTTAPDPTTTTQDPTTTAVTTTGSGATEAMTGTTTTGSVDPPTTTGSSSSSSTTDAPDTSSSSTTTGDSSSSSSSTGGDCHADTVFCDGNTAIVCDGMGGVESEEDCPKICVDDIGCVECLDPAPEVCDGLDNDCDGIADNGDVCGPGSCFGGGGQCQELAIPPGQSLVSGCAQQFPPAQSLPCPIPERGPQFFLSATTGDDGNDGTSPSTAWATLCHAIEAAPAGASLLVAEGDYPSASVYLGKELIVKGGFAVDFTTWDPDLHPTIFHGRLTLDHNAAVFGGFRMIANPLAADNWSYAHHFVGAGTLVRNYIEIVATSGADQNVLNLYGIVASACPDGVTVLRCNDIYVRSSAPQAFVVSAVEYGNHALHAGQAVLDANRICQDGGGWATDAVGGYGSCFPDPVSLLMRNNIFEKAGPGGGTAVSFYSCGEGDMSLVLTNNTILTRGDGIQATGDPAVLTTWRLTNNIVFSQGGGNNAVDLGAAGVELTSSEGNLTFGFQSNAILPAPLVTAGDDTTGLATPATVFLDAASGDLHLAPAGQGVGTGLNVYNLPDYGSVTADLLQIHRDPVEVWDRGAIVH